MKTSFFQFCKRNHLLDISAYLILMIGGILLLLKGAEDQGYYWQWFRIPKFLYEFKDGLNKYFDGLGPDAPVKDLEDLIEKTFADSVEMRYFDHEILKASQAKGDLNSSEYMKAVATSTRLSREEGIDKVMDELDLDAIIAPSGGPAWKTDLTNGDNFGIGSSSPAAIAGYPSISLPMGNIDGLPVGISIFGRAWTESLLLEIAYSFEQGTNHRMTPKYLND